MCFWTWALAGLAWANAMPDEVARKAVKPSAATNNLILAVIGGKSFFNGERGGSGEGPPSLAAMAIYISVLDGMQDFMIFCKYIS